MIAAVPLAGVVYDVSFAIGTVVGLGLFLLPTAIALSRRVANRWIVVAINLLLGATGIGWVVALAMAVRTKTLRDP
jgi:hypothetical protein